MSGNSDLADRLENLERRLAYCERANDDLSDVVIRQSDEITRLTRIVERLRSKVVDIESGWGGASPQDEKPPPHY